MKQIKSILQNTIDKAELKTSFYQEPEITERDAEVVNYIFKRLAGIIPAFKYSTSCVTTCDSIRLEYTYALMGAKIKSIERINAAINRIRSERLKFLPSPGEFIEFCKVTPEDVGAPGFDDAYKEAIKNAYPDGSIKTWSHVAVKYAYDRSDPYFLRTESSAKTRERFNESYTIAINDYAEGKILRQLETKKTKQDYQNYVGKIKSDINLCLTPADTTILTYEEWLHAG